MTRVGPTSPTGPDQPDGDTDGEAGITRIRYRRRIPGRSGVRAEWPGWVPEELVAACNRLRIDGPWRHQRDAADLLWRGRSVVLTTGTASGKSLAYVLPLATATWSGAGPPFAGESAAPAGGFDAQRWRQRPHTALYLSPTKALAHDQLQAWEALLPGWRVAAVDGDSEPDERDWAREHAVALLTNPDFLHHVVLPDHARWAGVLRALRFVVVDEAHRYSGVFGSQVALVLRRLRRLAAHYGADPVFAVCSATMADTVAGAATLTGLPAEAIEVVGEDASARAAVEVSFVEPKGSVEDATADLLADRVRRGRQSVAFVRSRRLAEQVAMRAADRLGLGGRDLVAAYRSGYLARDRRRLEAGLRDGTVRGVAATNALELGVDLAGLDTVVLCGYPGSRAAFWQQAGRAGRRGAPAEVVLLGARRPVDRWVLDHPEAVFDAPVESVVLRPERPLLLGPHLLAAAQELPLSPVDAGWFAGGSEIAGGRWTGSAARFDAEPGSGPDHRRGDMADAASGGEPDAECSSDPGSTPAPDASPGTGFAAVVADLVTQGLLRARGREWYWTRPERAADRIGLRSVHGRGVQIIEADIGRVLGSVDPSAAPLTVHPGAVYLHQGETYVVDELDPVHDEALVRRADPGYLTQPRVHTESRILSVTAERPLGRGVVALGEVEHREQVTGYLRRDVASGQVWDDTPLELPAALTRSVAVWWRLPAGRFEPASDATPVSHRRLDAAVHAAEHACAGLLPAFVACDPWDLGSSSAVEEDGCVVAVHDQLPGGVGFAAYGFAVAEDWLAAARDRVRACDCSTGCPACIVSPRCASPRGLDKAGAVILLSALVD